ncbi:MAG: anaerobic ribonucleoside-triphosphate reductase activating protein [Spirochaetaceae bacterium]|nr:anaerobic ribonucleoside-triphosphate reductase activating protein [Spirochaetaceae bacterium]
MLTDAKAGTLVKTSLVDFPTRVSAVMFFVGCNLRCPYCYNHAVVHGDIPQEELLSLADLEAFFQKRHKVLSGFVASGGEALLSPLLPRALEMAKDFGLATKLDTNGTLPEKLISLFENDETRPDYLAVDVKTSPKRYDSLLGQGYGEKILATLDFLKALDVDSYEIRTVLVPTMVDSREITEIGESVSKDANWFLAQFRAENCLNPQFNDLIPYDEAKLQSLADLAKTKVPNARLR